MKNIKKFICISLILSIPSTIHSMSKITARTPVAQRLAQTKLKQILQKRCLYTKADQEALQDNLKDALKGTGAGIVGFGFGYAGAYGFSEDVAISSGVGVTSALLAASMAGGPAGALGLATATCTVGCGKLVHKKYKQHLKESQSQ